MNPHYEPPADSIRRMNAAGMGFSVPLWPLAQDAMTWDNDEDVAREGPGYGPLSQPGVDWLYQVIGQQAPGANQWLPVGLRSRSSWKQFAWWFWMARSLQAAVTVSATVTHWFLQPWSYLWVPWTSTLTGTATVTLEDQAGAESHPWEESPTLHDKFVEAGADERKRQLVALWNRSRGIVDSPWSFAGTMTLTHAGDAPQNDGTFVPFSDPVDLDLSFTLTQAADRSKPALVTDNRDASVLAAITVLGVADTSGGLVVFESPAQGDGQNRTGRLVDDAGRDLADAIHHRAYELHPAEEIHSSYLSANASTVTEIKVIPWAA